MIKKGFKILKYLISGGSAAALNIVFLFIFVEWFNMWYVLASVFAFLIAFVASFLLQKFWTFNNTSKEGVHKQAMVYFIVAVVNLCINTFLIYVFVEYFYLHYIVSQIIAGGLIAISSFFIYSHFIFHHKKPLDLSSS